VNEIKKKSRKELCFGLVTFDVQNNVGLLFKILPGQPVPLVSQGGPLSTPPQELLSLRLFNLGFKEPFP
jgi:hypothetical protein